jgi:hypothetical protein
MNGLKLHIYFSSEQAPGLTAAYGIHHIPKDNIDHASAALRVLRSQLQARDLHLFHG